MPVAKTRSIIKVHYAYVDGAHFFTSPEVPGLCAASTDLETAYRSVSPQLSRLVKGPDGKMQNFVPGAPVERFKEWLESRAPRATIPDISDAAVAKWAMMTNQ